MSKRILGLVSLVLLTAACSSSKTDQPALRSTQQALDPEDIGCRIGASPPPATIAWETEGLTGTVSAATETYARVKNWTTSGLAVRVFLRAEGIDGRAVERELTATTIDPEDTLDVPFHWQDLPLQSATSTSMASVVVELIEGDIAPEQEHLQIPSGTLAYASYWNYEDFEFYGSQEDPTTLFGAVEDAQDLHDGLAYWDTWFNEREGRVWDGEELVDVNLVPLDDDPNMTPLRVNRLSMYDTLVFDTLPKTLVAGPTGTDKFCPKLPAAFVDSGFGESQANGRGLQYLPASYMDLEIIRRDVISSTVFYTPYARHRLGSNGCTNQLTRSTRTRRVLRPPIRHRDSNVPVCGRTSEPGLSPGDSYVAGGGVQRCGSSASMSDAGCDDTRISTSRRYSNGFTPCASHVPTSV